MDRIFLNCDCMDKEKGMSSYPDKYFDLAIVDPPYGLDITNIWGDSKYGYTQYENKEWDKKIPDYKYFDELFRVSKNQIIWGGNYFPLKPTKCFLIWDKMQRNFSLADAELAWCSFDKCVRIFSFSRASAMQSNGKNKFHPTQKPVELYKWIVKNYAKEGYKILDTHVGSASSLIAFEEFGLDYVGYEIDADYYQSACERIEKYRMQPRLFENTFES